MNRFPLVEAGSVPGSADMFRQDMGHTTLVSARVPADFRAFVRVRAGNACDLSAPTADLVVQ